MIAIIPHILCAVLPLLHIFTYPASGLLLCSKIILCGGQLLFGSLSSLGDGIVRITLLTQVKKERKETNFSLGIEPGTQRLGVQYTSQLHWLIIVSASSVTIVSKSITFLEEAKPPERECSQLVSPEVDLSVSSM